MATIQGVYLALFGRPADPTGLSFFNSVTNNGANLSAIGNLATQAEYTSRFTGMSNVQIINSIYQSLFGRDADATGLTFFANQLASGRQTINTIAINILDGATGSDLTTVNNKIAAANLFTASLDTGSEIVAYSGTAAADAGRAFIAGITTTVPTQAAVDLVITNIVNNPAPATTTVLTTGVDNFVGTVNNDLFTGLKSATNPTLTASDTINGGAGIDTLNITVDQAGNVLAGAQISNIEIVGIRATANTANELDATGLTSVVLTGTNTSTTAITNLANSATVTVGSGANLTGAITAGYVAAATTTNIAYAGGTSGDLTANGATAFTTANISSTGSANKAGTVTVGAATTINVNATTNFTATAISTTGTNSTLKVSGVAESVNVGTLDSDLRTIDASGLTAGGLTATLSNAAQVVTGGAGNDVISTGGLGLLTGSVNAGAGTADRLVLTATADLDTTAKGAKYTNFEVLQVENGVTGNVDNIAGITAIRINDAGGATAVNNLTATQAGAITVVAGDATGAITIGVKGAATVGQIDTVKIDANDGATTVGTIALGKIAMAGVENLELTATDNITITDLTDSAALSSIVLKGAGTINITTEALATVNAHIDGSAATGVQTINASNFATNGIKITTGSAADTITGSAQADNITSGAGNDTITAGDGADTVVAGDGNDSITGGVGADTLTGGAGVDTFVYTTLTHSLAAAADRITDFVAGTDKIDVTTVPAAILQGTAYTAAGTGTLATDIATALTAGGGTLAADGAAVVTITGTGAGTYLILNNGTAGYVAGDDAVVNITGLTGTLTVSDFV
ncbi:bluetail domain-containing putative surface protein [Rhizobium sp. FKY42]|uniref:bluetail domain-containing putative surface protein n=1 Tax=Rhizobium sp. FKY42 TaxID=2562310 RepID=UPI0010C0E9BD|nr:bluetail domain-containing putative surface protein [Rhizobium sp. FKY42]